MVGVFQKKRQRIRCRAGSVHPKMFILTRPIQALALQDSRWGYLVLSFCSVSEHLGVPMPWSKRDFYQISKAIGNLNLSHWINQLGY
jgi:hypothetical protein